MRLEAVKEGAALLFFRTLYRNGIVEIPIAKTARTSMSALNEFMVSLGQWAGYLTASSVGLARDRSAQGDQSLRNRPRMLLNQPAHLCAIIDTLRKTRQKQLSNAHEDDLFPGPVRA